MFRTRDFCFLNPDDPQYQSYRAYVISRGLVSFCIKNPLLGLKVAQTST